VVEVEVDDCVVKKKGKKKKRGEEGNREVEIRFGPVTGKEVRLPGRGQARRTTSSQSNWK
jgi:hypothetical protein